jgi:hypothetical protein
VGHKNAKDMREAERIRKGKNKPFTKRKDMIPNRLLNLIKKPEDQQPD